MVCEWGDRDLFMGYTVIVECTPGRMTINLLYGGEGSLIKHELRTSNRQRMQ